VQKFEGVIKFAQEKIKKIQIKVSTLLIQQLSSSFYPNIRMVFEELVANSRDAMATESKIYVGEDRIVIEDNGEGMLPEQLEKFFYISYTEKEPSEVRMRGNIARQVIGKFGIGKLSLYRICNVIEIESWRNGIESRAHFDFRVFESHEFIDEFKLEVKSGKDEGHRTDSGTVITLLDLKTESFEHPIDAMHVKRDFMENMEKIIPIGDDFTIFISGVGLTAPVALAARDIVEGSILSLHLIDENVKNLGKVSGRIAYLEHGTVNAGVYVRVLKRIVNYDNPKELIDFADLSHGRMFARRVIAEINCDELNDALQTNRSGFIKDNAKFIIFHEWLKRAIRHYNEIEYKKWEQIRDRIQTEEIPRTVSGLIKNTLEETQTVKKNKMNFDVQVKPLGPLGPEAKFETKTNTVIINSEHPMYLYAISNGKTWGTYYHSLKSTIVFFALGISKNLKDFERIYNEITTGSKENVEKIKLRRVRYKPKKQR
jgi:uncharacterized protein YjaG (DUF416 family)